MARRVVVTGVGAVSGMGIGIGALWQGLVEGRSCLAPMSRFDASGFPCPLAGELRDFSAREFVPKSYRKAVKVMARDIELAVGAAKCAVEDARIVTRGTLPDGEAGGDARLTYPAERMGCQIGAGLIAAEVDELTMALATARNADGRFDIRAWGGAEGGGMENLTPLWLLKYLPNMLACHVTIIHGAEGPSNTITCSEASGMLSIGESVRVIERGSADLCFSGGAESKLNPMGFLRMDLAGWLAHSGSETDGSKVVHPFDLERPSGTVLGEGGGILILEEMEAARARGATMYAECAGFGAGHADLPQVARMPGGSGDGGGCRAAIESALEDAGIGPEKIDAIVPLASGVAQTDRAEAEALRGVFGSRLAQVPLVTLAPNIGNCMAGQGALQAAVAAVCLREQRLPARVHHGRWDADFQAGPAPSRPANLEYMLVCTPALGGQNAALVLRRTG
jgi:3-oxoacyl-[acyl-carrier-protein] synthase II